MEATHQHEGILEKALKYAKDEASLVINLKTLSNIYSNSNGVQKDAEISAGSNGVTDSLSRISTNP